MDNRTAERNTPGGPNPWSEGAKRSWQVWRNYYPSLGYARGDPKTFYVDIDRAAHMAGLTRRNFYYRYLRSGRLAYEVKTWFHGRKRRQKSFVQRAALLELLSRELLEAARLQMLRRRPRPGVISRKATVADLERELEQRTAGRRQSLQLDKLD